MAAHDDMPTNAVEVRLLRVLRDGRARNVAHHLRAAQPIVQGVDRTTAPAFSRYSAASDMKSAQWRD
jgi:hypothetical protein